MSLYREFPWVPWESHGNRNYYCSSMGMGKSVGMAMWEWEGMKKLHYPFLTQSKVINLYHWKKDRHMRKLTQFRHLDMDAFRHLHFWFDFQLFLLPKDFHLLSVTGYLFHDIHEKNNNRCDEILLWDWQWEGIGITNRTWKGMRVKRWEREGLELKNTFRLISTGN